MYDVKSESQPDTIALLGINYCLQIIETGFAELVLCLSHYGAGTDSFENFCEISLKGDHSNDITLNPPLLSTVNTFKVQRTLKNIGINIRAFDILMNSVVDRQRYDTDPGPTK